MLFSDKYLMNLGFATGFRNLLMRYIIKRFYICYWCRLRSQLQLHLRLFCVIVNFRRANNNNNNNEAANKSNKKNKITHNQNKHYALNRIINTYICFRLLHHRMFVAYSILLHLFLSRRSIFT